MTDEEKNKGGRPPKQLPKIGDNINPVKDAVADALQSMDDIEKKRSKENDRSAALLSKLKDMGISKDAFRMARRYLKLPEHKKQQFDLAYKIVREAGGEPIEPDLFA